MSKSRRPRRAQGTSNTQRITLGGVVAAVLFAIVLIAQYALGVNVLNEEEATNTPPAPKPVAVVPGVSTLTPIDGGYDGGWFQLYFTSPINTQDESRFTGSPVENALVTALDGAQQSIDAAVFEFNSQPVTDALVRAAERGVQVRVVTDGEFGLEQPDATIDQLELADIPVVSDGSRRGYMHDKFFVIDDLYVWTGSTNITHNDIYNNNNNSILIRSSRLAANYAAEFEELFAGTFGASSPKDILNPSVTVEGTRIDTIFESEGDVPTRLVELINNAHSVRFMAFSLTRADLIQPMLARALSGDLDLMGIVESSQRRFVKDLMCAGLQVHRDGNPDILHHKVFIVDDSIVVMGSFNFSNNAANDNDENTLIIYNSDIASAYLEEFQRRWAESEAVPVSDLDC